MPDIKKQSDNKTNTAVETTELLSNQIIDAIRDVKGQKITEINMERLPMAPAFRFIVCQGKSTTQVSAIADSIEDKVRRNCDTKPYSVDGLRNSQWVVLDYGSVMAHVFLPEAREAYNLEELWSDAQITNLPDSD